MNKNDRSQEIAISEHSMIIETMERKYQSKLDEFPLDGESLFTDAADDYDGHDPRITSLSISLADNFHNFLMEEGVVTRTPEEKLKLLITAIYDGVWDSEVTAKIPELTQQMNLLSLTNTD